MKKHFLIISLCIFCHFTSSTQAQYVTIPDTNFVNWLNTNGYAACMTGNQMDTLCNAILTAHTVDCNWANISDLTGITYFDSLQTLICGANNLSTLPALPSFLTELQCGGNHLTSLPSQLPSTLLTINCLQNNLVTLPALPNSLRLLLCFKNHITSLPALPDSLLSFDCHDNLISSMPALPLNLQSLDCRDNLIDSLPTLNAGLLQLDCSNNLLDTIPLLPASLQGLSFYANQVSNLPVLPNQLQFLSFSGNNVSVLQSLPSSLTYLDCRSNSISVLPTLPAGIFDLRCSHNLLSALPVLPDTMNSLLIRDNPGITCLPSVKYVYFSFDWTNTGIQCLPNTIGYGMSATPPLAGVPICGYINVNNCTPFWNIQGSIVTDSNSNCTADSNEIHHQHIKLNLKQNGVLKQQTFTDLTGAYYFDTDTGVYIYELDTFNLPYIVDCPASGFYASSFLSNNTIYHEKDFAISCKPGFDVGVSVISRDSGIFRPGDTARVIIGAGDISNIYNLNCANGISGVVTIVINGKADFINAIPGSLIPAVNGDTLIYTIADFGTVNFYNDFKFLTQVDTTAQIGNYICFDVNVTPLTGDDNTFNNYYSHCFNIVNSYDPNEKEVSPSGATDTSQHWLTYTIRFQNTGNAPAEQIYIDDTLDNNVDETSFQLLAYSHETLVQISGKKARFNFHNINLPDSVNNEPHSHGYVQYKVKRKDNLPIGTQIRNTAYIYFDFNSPVQTNTTINTLVIPTGVAQIRHQETSLSIYPNPANGNSMKMYFYSPTKTTGKLNIYELSGRLIYSSMVASSEQSQKLALPVLAPGIYQCMMSYSGGFSTQKLVIIH